VENDVEVRDLTVGRVVPERDNGIRHQMRQTRKMWQMRYRNNGRMYYRQNIYRIKKIMEQMENLWRLRVAQTPPNKTTLVGHQIEKPIITGKKWCHITIVFMAFCPGKYENCHSM
jgi:hypothetical protein